MSAIVELFRVENAEHVGPYCGRATRAAYELNRQREAEYLEDMYYIHGRWEPEAEHRWPIPRMDHGIGRRTEMGEVCALTREQLAEWFTPEDIRAMDAVGFRLTRILAESPGVVKGVRQCILEERRIVVRQPINYQEVGL